MIEKNYVIPFFEEHPDNIEEILQTVIRKNTLCDTRILDETFKEWCKRNTINPELLLATLKESILNGNLVVQRSSIYPEVATGYLRNLKEYRHINNYLVTTKQNIPISEKKPSFFFRFYDALINCISLPKK